MGTVVFVAGDAQVVSFALGEAWVPVDRAQDLVGKQALLER